MHWMTFGILVYLSAALQASQLGALSGGGALRPEFLALLAIFYGLYAAEEGALLAAFLCGLLCDLLTDQGFLGTSAVALGLCGWGVVKIRLSIFREHAISQAIISFVMVWLFGLLSATLGKFSGSNDSWSRWMSQSLGSMLINALYSGLLAPGLFWLLLRLGSLLGFDSSRRRHRGASG